MTIEKCQRCIGSHACQSQVVNECLPVNAFGDVSGKSVEVATIGLNPALNEFFYNGAAKERSQRLPILNDYNVTSRANLQNGDIDDAKKRRETYFKDPDRGCHPHFEKLESLVSRVQPAWSYLLGNVVHIDLVACATEVRWGDLSNNCQAELLTNCRGHFLATLSRLPNGTLLFFDGTRVVSEMKQIGLQFKQEGGEKLINIRGNRGCIGELKFGDKTFPFRGWSIPVGKLTMLWRYDLAFWIRGTLPPAK
jgi:hypothetical protein